MRVYIPRMDVLLCDGFLISNSLTSINTGVFAALTETNEISII